MGAEAFKAVAEEELQKAEIPLPSELVVGIIHAETRGTPGEVNPKSGAAGLMQIMPIALKQYNQDTGSAYKMADLKGTDAESIRIQIRVGVHLLGNYWRSAHKYIKSSGIPDEIENQTKTAQLFYVAGPGGGRKALDSVPGHRFADLAKKRPTWSAVVYCRTVWNKTQSLKPTWNLSSIDKWLGGSFSQGDLPENPKPEQPSHPVLIADSKAREGILLGLMIIAIFSYFLTPQKND